MREVLPTVNDEHRSTGYGATVAEKNISDPVKSSFEMVNLVVDSSMSRSLYSSQSTDQIKGELRWIILMVLGDEFIWILLNQLERKLRSRLLSNEIIENDNFSVSFMINEEKQKSRSRVSSTGSSSN